MYLVGNAITITWVLPPDDSVTIPGSDYYDVSFGPGNLDNTYTNDAITDHVAPTAEIAGSITYTFTPVLQGLYHVILSHGTADSYSVLAEKRCYVFAGAPATDNGILAHAPPSIKIISFGYALATHSFPEPAQSISTDRNGNWVVVCANNTVWYSSDPANTWTEATFPASTTPPDYVCNDQQGNWLIMGGRGDMFAASTDNGVNWTVNFDTVKNWNGVNTLFYAPGILSNKFFTFGAAFSLHVPIDGTGGGTTVATRGPWQGSPDPNNPIDHVTAVTKNFAIHDNFQLMHYGSDGFGSPRNGTATNGISWLMHDTMPNVPTGPGDVHDGEYAVAENQSINSGHYMVNNGGLGIWSPGHYAKDGVDIKFIHWSDYLELWYLANADGDWYTTDNVRTGTWTALPSGYQMQGQVIKDFAGVDDEGPDAWIIINTVGDLVINEIVEI